MPLVHENEVGYQFVVVSVHGMLTTSCPDAFLWIEYDLFPVVVSELGETVWIVDDRLVVVIISLLFTFANPSIYKSPYILVLF